MIRLTKIAILLPTYNGEEFIEEQVCSILNQSYKDIVIVTRDDGSSDRTQEIIKNISRSNPSMIHIVESNGENIGTCKNISYLMEYIINNKKNLQMPACYMMFCDQDDVWKEDKINLEMKAMKELEDKYKYKPILVYSDLQVVDKNMNTIAKSFRQYQGLRPMRNKFRHQLILNTVTGCTALVNEELVKISLPIPEDAIMHDWWLSICASAFGHLEYLPIALVNYRQHENNTTGANESKQEPIISSKLFSRVFNKKHSKYFSDVVLQAKVFASIYKLNITMKQKCEIYIIKKLIKKNVIIQKAIYKILQW